MNNISVLLPVSSTTNPEDLHRSFKSLQQQAIKPGEIILVTNQKLDADINIAINNLDNTNSNTRHEHFSDASGLGGVLQSGLQSCSGRFVARMDADDIAEPERFSEQLDVLTETDADIVGSHLAEFYEDPEDVRQIRKVPTTHDEIAKWMSWRCPINHPTVMFCREKISDIGGYRDFPHMEDWDLWARSLAAGLQFRNIDRALVRGQVENLSDRRGGLDYAKVEFQMAKELRELGIAATSDTIRHLCFRIPIRLLPRRLRKEAYQLFAR